ncbi:MAG: ATP phosphoribosyltransferase regulatory subunit [Paracoccaceae bacterium]|jgi:ATP phosphoribosyltransferase regulatory subunit
MTDKAAVRAEAERLFAFLQAAGGQPVEADILQPAGTLLDLYGEDIRARAYVTTDPDRGELMLRPDFTVPVVQMHMANGADPARYTYMGEVFRKQEAASNRASEYLQVGYEVFDRMAPSVADAEVFALFSEVLAPLALRPATGDIGILKAAVAGLSTTPRRRAALMRHIWRPRRFRALVDRFTGRIATPATRTAMLANLTNATAMELIERAGPLVGARSAEEIALRATVLEENARIEPIGMAEAEVLDAILGLRETLPNAHAQLLDIAVDLPAMIPAIDRMAERMDAMTAKGVEIEDLSFEASYGRTLLEYYDGFVFGFMVEGRPDLPPVASGGRYDALTRVLGKGREIPAVGGVIRPELVHMLGGIGK